MSIRPLAKLFALLVAVLSAAPATAEVTSATPNGFSIRVVTPIRAERAEVYAAAVGEVGSWWHDDHTVSGFAANLYLDTQVPGCFCESLGEGSAIVHMMVTYVSTNIVVRLTGGLGPLGLMGVNGNMTWEFDDAESGTVVTLNYAVGGYNPDGLDAIAPAVDGVLANAMGRLRNFVETGSPAPAE